jgi:hypothetical protein
MRCGTLSFRAGRCRSNWLPTRAGSEAAEQGGEGDAEGGGDFPEGFDGDRLGAAFHLADVNGVEIRLFGQGFLAQLGFPAEVPDVRADALADCLD